MRDEVIIGIRIDMDRPCAMYVVQPQGVSVGDCGSVSYPSRYRKPATTDKKIDVFYAGGKLPEHEKSLSKGLRNLPGRYVKSETEMKWTYGNGRIEWDETRRRWSHSVFDQVLFCLPCGDGDPTSPATEGWLPTPLAANIPAPCYRRSQLVSLGCTVRCLPVTTVFIVW